MSSIRSRLRSYPFVLAALVSVTFAIALHDAPAARASPTQISMMMDDNLLAYASNPARYAALDTMKKLGVEMVRVTVLWSVIAKGTRNPATHHRFDPTNPADYPRGVWTNYDQLVVDAEALGMYVDFNITGPGPSWAMGKTRDRTMKPSYMPNVGQFANFVKAVGTRFSGTYAPRTGATPLPKVSTWAIWNEPNQVGWLSPQAVYNRRLHHILPYSPILYRRLFYAARHALNVTGHSTDTVLAGETAPLGSPPQNGRTPMRPGQFIREFFCVNSHLEPLTGLQASVRGCAIFKRDGPLQASGWAHHPYTKAEPPTWVDKSRDSIVIANIAALPKLLDRIAANTQRVASGLPIWITEMGYESNPPDPYRGVSLADQAAFINETDYLAYKQSRVVAVTQFLLEDAPPNPAFKGKTRGYWDTYQSGLEFGPGSGRPPGTPKPAYPAYAMPIWVASAGTAADAQLELWAQVKFRAGQVTPSDELVFQFEPTGSTSWTTVTPVEPLSADGFVDVTVPAASYAAPGNWRAVWSGPGGLYLSRDAPNPG